VSTEIKSASRFLLASLTLFLAAVPLEAQFVPTATKALSLKGAIRLGPLASAKQIHIVVGLKMQNASQVQTTLRRMLTPGDSLYGKSLTPQEFTSQFAPTSAQITAVKEYLAAYGFTNISVEDNNLLIQADGSVTAIETAFDTELAQFSVSGKVVFANTLDVQVPKNLSGTVLSVLGLNNISALQLPTPPSTSNALNGYTPQDFRTAYNAGNTSPGSNVTIAIFAEGNLTQVIADLRLFEKANKLPEAPVTLVYAGIPSADTSGADEWDLDTQTSTGMAPNAHLYVYVATSLTDADTALTFNKFVTDNKAKAGSASYGECELFPYLDGAMVTDDEIFAEAALQGQTVFSSTGDVGASCPVLPTNGVPLSGPPLVSYPAASPYVIGVGGTDLFTNTGYTYDFETAWNAGGGGISQFETSPFWQSGVVPTAADGLRGLPDVSMCADPDTCGAVIYVSGATEVVGGTSLSSPLSLGVWARIEATHSQRLGFAGPLIYQLAKGVNTSTLGAPDIVGFNDIVLGSNGYPATIGWDYATGLGSWNIAKVSSLIPSSYPH
jgi:subtilase family serine protease